MTSRFHLISFASVCVCLLLAAPAAAQDPLQTLPDAYRLQFENDWVKVVRVRYPAETTLPDHTHPAGTTAYVYLTDSERVVFRHSGGGSSVVTRPPVTAGSIRLAAGREEHHSAENPTAAPSEFLRIQIKAMGSGNMRRRIPRDEARSGATGVTVEYTSGPLVIQRFVIAAGASMPVEAEARPALWVAIPSGETRWADAGHVDTLANTGETPMEWLRFLVRAR